MTSPGASDIVVADVQTQRNTKHPIDRLTFPHDFPAMPKGVTIISLSAWKERGICVEPRAGDPDELEVDTLGIPTVPMTAHKTDYCKTKTRRKKKKEQAKMKYLDSGGTLPWWAQWEENESVRLAKPTDASDSRLSKFLSAAGDFKNGRKWPLLVNSQIDASRLWTMMEVFLGIEGQPRKAARPSRRKVFHDILEDEIEDSDSDDGMEVDSDGEMPTTVDGKGKRALSFINDPEKAVKIFLSSYVRAKGVIWSKINLEQTPRLWMFFLEFLLRSRVLPRSEAGFRAALEVAKQALLELPLTGILSGLLPDEFSKACRECWGAQTEVFRSLDLSDEWLAQLRAGDAIVEAANKAADASAESDLEVIPEPEQEEGGGEKEKMEGNSWGGGWGANESAGGWGTTGEAEREWGAGVDMLDENSDNPWMTVEDDRSFLMRLMGPTLLPLTHTTGVVEQSLRRITDLIPIPTNIPTKPAVSESDPIVADPAAIEAELEKVFPKVVLSPWLKWDGGEMPAFSDPRILDTSQGPVVEPPYALKTDSAATVPKAHDPGNDSVIVLVHPATFEKLLKGMCFAGTWVQIVRQPVEAGNAAPARKKKGKKKTPANFWYMDELGGVFPSYWSVRS